MDLDDAEDEVLVEYPLFSSNEKSLFSGSASAGEGRIRLVNMHYPLRSPMRPYNIYDVKDVSYKRNHRVLSMTVPEDRPDMVCLPWPELVSSQTLSNTHRPSPFSGAPQGYTIDWYRSCTRGATMRHGQGGRQLRSCSH